MTGPSRVVASGAGLRAEGTGRAGWSCQPALARAGRAEHPSRRTGPEQGSRLKAEEPPPRPGPVVQDQSDLPWDRYWMGPCWPLGGPSQVRIAGGSRPPPSPPPFRPRALPHRFGLRCAQSGLGRPVGLAVGPGDVEYLSGRGHSLNRLGGPGQCGVTSRSWSCRRRVRAARLLGRNEEDKQPVPGGDREQN